MRPKCGATAARLVLVLIACLVLASTPALATKKVMDLISSDPGFSRLVKELQRNRLVFLLNNRKTCTFFAPTNAAFAKWDSDHQDKRIDKATLLYHILPDNFLTQDLKDAMLLETLLVREGYLGNHSEGQLVAVSKPSWRPGRKARLLVGDAELLEKDWQADNGVVHVVDRLLSPPVDLVETMQKHDELSAIANIVHAAGLDELLRQHRPFTLFAPTGDALKKLNNIQVRYLRHPQGRKDLEITFQHHIHAGTLYRQDIRPGTSSVSTLEGQELMINLEEEKLLVDNAQVEKTDILASNGVIHTVSRPLLPSALVWTPAKYLVGLNATKFVDSLRESGLSRYIDDPEASYTIFAPQDDSWTLESQAATEEIKDVLLYHVVPGKKFHTNFQDGQLLQTELYTEQLNDGAQRSKISVKQDNKRTVVSIDDVEIKGEPVQVGKSLIYLVARPLPLPLPLVRKLRQEESLSAFVDALMTTGLGRRLPDARAITVFAPSTSAWEDLGAVKDYLLLDDTTSTSALEAVVRYAIVDGIHYTPDLKSGRTVLKTSEGSELTVEKDNSAIYVGEGRLERSEQVGGKVISKDILVDSGVVHTVSAVALPPTLAITLFNVLQGASTHDFLTAFQTSNITRILTNWEQDFTIFAPTDEAFKKAGLEGALNDKDFVARLVRLHVIPGKVLKLKEDIDNDEASMLNMDAKLNLRDIHGDGKSFGVRVKGARSKKEARIVDKGFAHPAWPSNDEYQRSRGRVGMTHQDGVAAASQMAAPQPGGVVYVIDRVLLPGDPDPLGAAWFWIGIIVFGLLCTTALCALTALSMHALIKELRHLEGYTPVAATDEEAGTRGPDEYYEPAGAAATEPVADTADSGDTAAAEAAQANNEENGRG
ncbi:hypothetical protein EDD11_005030 [Mortierella claussenii]|nr:hypothetical protein EDD11_005030 [Mortierella claussenii]